MMMSVVIKRRPWCRLNCVHYKDNRNVHFPAMQLVSLVNHPVLVKDAYQRVCIAEFGYRLFVNISTSQKIALCTEISNSGVTVKPHSSRLAFVRGRCTIRLYILIQAMVATKITNTLMIGYGIKMSYAESLFIDELEGPPHRRRFDIGRNVEANSIPVFGISQWHSHATLFPMFGNMGAGFGSISLQLLPSSSHVQSLTIKCYPRILHYLKGSRITMDLPQNNFGIRSKLTILLKLSSN